MIKSENYGVKSDPQSILDFLANTNNLIEILPQERIENWQADESTCSFKIKGLAHIALKLESKSSNRIIFISAQEKPFSFELVINVEAEGEKAAVQAEFNPSVNAFLMSMLKSPMTNFLNHLGQALQAKFESA